MTTTTQERPLSPAETRLLDRLYRTWQGQKRQDIKNEQHFEGLQKIAQLGISIPPELEAFAFPMNWCRLFVETVEQRMDVQRILRGGDLDEDEDLRLDWDANDLDLESQLIHQDLLLYGRCAASVSWPSRELGQTRPVIRAESPRDIAVEVDPVSRQTTGALRVYLDETGLNRHLTLYLANETIHMRQELGRWTVSQRDQHNLGRVPVVVQWRGRKTGRWSGTSIMTDIMHWVALAARVVLNLQLAMETIATPQKVALGVKREDFIDPETGEQLDPWETYLGAIWALSKGTKDGVDIKQLPAGELTGFIATMELITKQVAAQTGLPLRMLGHSTVNPASEGGIKADEARLIKIVERVNDVAGAFWGWVMGISERIRSGSWPEGSPIKLLWRNPATPTLAEMADAVQKQTGGAPVLSIRGAHIDMGWSEERSQRERRWLDEEQSRYFTAEDAKSERDFEGGAAWA